MKGESQMIIRIELDTDNPRFVSVYNDNHSLGVEYSDIAPDELCLEEIINDILT